MLIAALGMFTLVGRLHPDRPVDGRPAAGAGIGDRHGGGRAHGRTGDTGTIGYAGFTCSSGRAGVRAAGASGEGGEGSGTDKTRSVIGRQFAGCEVARALRRARLPQWPRPR